MSLLARQPLLELLRQVTKLQGKEPEDILVFLSEVYGPVCARHATEHATRSQDSSPAWHQYRNGLVTASIAHHCMTKAKTFLRSKNVDVFYPIHFQCSRLNGLTT
ncbi:hypothetical protein HPB50_028874 [Hyalomma asiaticum]|nr:hypothetical protein HPB50_028874 [Hyalomma asiaticum]